MKAFSFLIFLLLGVYATIPTAAECCDHAELTGCQDSLASLSQELAHAHASHDLLFSQQELTYKLSVLGRASFAMFVHLVKRFTGFDIRELAHPEDNPKLAKLAQPPFSTALRSTCSAASLARRAATAAFDAALNFAKPVIDFLNKSARRMVGNIVAIDPSLRRAFSIKDYDALYSMMLLVGAIYLVLGFVESCFSKLCACTFKCCQNGCCPKRSVGVQTHATQPRAKSSANITEPITEAYKVDPSEISEARRRLSAK